MRTILQREAGYSMTEVLVSILLLSSGVLGLAGLQMAATRTTQQSAYQTMALRLAADIAETVHAAASDQGNVAVLEPMFDVDYTSTPGSLPAAESSCHFAACGPGEFVAFEISEWKTRLATTFPAARLRICRDNSPSDEAGHAYTWDCAGGGGNTALVIKVGWRVKNPDGRYANDGDSFPPSVVIPVTPA